MGMPHRNACETSSHIGRERLSVKLLLYSGSRHPPVQGGNLTQLINNSGISRDILPYWEGTFDNRRQVQEVRHDILPYREGTFTNFCGLIYFVETSSHTGRELCINFRVYSCTPRHPPIQGGNKRLYKIMEVLPARHPPIQGGNQEFYMLIKCVRRDILRYREGTFFLNKRPFITLETSSHIGRELI